jgi:hypothetical protein
MTSTEILPLHIEAADRACRSDDMPALAAAVRRLVPSVPRDVRFEATAIAELARLRVPTARERWQRLAARLAA